MDRVLPIHSPVPTLQVLSGDGELILCRGHRSVHGRAALAVYPASEHPRPAVIERLAHEHALADELDSRWAARPLALVNERGRPVLLLEDPGGQSLEALLDGPMAPEAFMRVAAAIAATLRNVHQRGLVHREIKPANILVDSEAARAWLTGFGIASRLPRQWQPLDTPESIAGTLAYMAPEQTGRMNRSIDSRSDLYSFGVTLYRMLTGALPFAATDPVEWVHAHTARKAVPPHERASSTPPALSAIVMKLLAKTPEERYQTAGGVEHDLRLCLAQWQARGRADAFALGERDIPDRLLVPERLYGREREMRALLASSARVAGDGTPELLLVSGYSGVGKSSVINELHKTLVAEGGRFGSGKFDLYKRDTPYTALAQTLQSIIRPLLGKSDAELQPWREALADALGANARLMSDLVPDLKLVVGEQPAVPELPWQESQSRFQMVLRGFIGVFAFPGRPLVLFFDDMQWVDAATLKLLTDLLTHPDVRHLLVIGAFRTNEVGDGHPLRDAVLAMSEASGRVGEIALAPLALGDIAQLVVDCLRCDPREAEPLARVVHERTGGNPFFAAQFLHTLAEKRLLQFDYERARWAWDLTHVQGEAYSESVVDLIVERLSRLPAATLHTIRCLACLGWVADSATLAIAVGTPEPEVCVHLLDASRLDLVVHLNGRYRFLHDRIQEAAYSLIPEAARAEAHLGIGRRLDAQPAAQRKDEAIFEIADQLNLGAERVGLPAEREHIAALNLEAAGRARAASAYASALTYLAAGSAMLTEDSWERHHAMAFALELQRAECELLTGERIGANERLARLAPRAASSSEQAAVACLRIDVLMTLGYPGQSVAAGLDYLRTAGIAWTAHPARGEMREEFEGIWRRLGTRPIEALVDLPLLEDEGWQAQMNVLTALLPPALFTDENLFCLLVARMANISMEHGNTHGSCLAYVWLGLLLGPHFDNYPGAFEFGRLGHELVEKRGLTRFRARVYLDFSHVVNPWMRHAADGPGLVRRALDAASAMGDLTFAAYSSCNLISALLAAGAPLAEVQQEAERQLAFARRLRFDLIADIIAGQLRLVMALRGLTAALDSFEGPGFSQPRFERRLEEDPGLNVAIGWYWVRKLQGGVFAGDWKGAMAAAAKVGPFLWTIPSHLEVADYHFYAAIACAASHDSAPLQERAALLHELRAHHARLASWARTCPENFEGRAALVAAEMARLEGREFEAQRLYEQSIRCASGNALVHDEALAGELAGRFYLAHGFERIALAYLRDARHCYLRWGADAKVRQIDESHANVRQPQPAAGPMGTIVGPVDHLDLATVIKVSQAVSSEVVLDRLLDTLMRTAIESAGAERGLLILPRGPEQRIAAEGTVDGEGVAVHLRDQPASAEVVPQSVLHYILRTRQSVILDDAVAQEPFSADPYVVRRRARSILCLPLMNQAKLVGVLYLENNLSSRMFAPARIAVLTMLASQAAISLENARLYRDLAEREAKIRRLVEAGIIGIFFWDFDGRILEANDAFLRMVGYERDDLEAGRLRWAELTPPEWRESDAQFIEAMKATGLIPPVEKEYLRKDGSRIPVLRGSALFEGGGSQGVAFVLDLTDRRRAEADKAKLEERLRQGEKMEAIGRFASGIAHDFNGVLGGIMACGEMLLDEAPEGTPQRRYAQNVMTAATRGRDLVGQILAYTRSQRGKRRPTDVCRTVVDALEFVRNSLPASITLHPAIPDEPLTVMGDATQLHQVVTNLCSNAADAMAEGGALRVAVAPAELAGERALSHGALRPGRYACVSVEDSGCGMDGATLARIFEPFFTTKEVGRGTGLGLALVYAIVTDFGGAIDVKSTPGTGSTFSIHIPLTSLPEGDR